MSRRRTFALLVALAALVALLSACGGGGSSEDPRQVIENATFEGVESGTINLTANVRSQGEHGGDMKIDLSGPFQSTGAKSFPELDLSLSANGEADGEKVDFEAGLTVLGDRAYVGFKGTEYEVDPTTFGFVKSGFEEAEQEGEKESKGGEATACRKAATSLDLEEFVDNLENEGSAEVEGTATTKLSGDLDPKGAVDAIVKLLETPACAAQVKAAGQLPLGELKQREGELTDAVKKAHVEVFVGEDDQIVRRVVADLTVAPRGSGERTEIELDFTLGKVNEQQAIGAPAKAEPLTDLFAELGINPVELLGLMRGGGAPDLGSLLEGLSGAIGGGSSAGGDNATGGGDAATEVVPSHVGGKQKRFAECLAEAEGATDVQQCAKLME